MTSSTLWTDFERPASSRSELDRFVSRYLQFRALRKAGSFYCDKPKMIRAILSLRNHSEELNMLSCSRVSRRIGYIQRRLRCNNGVILSTAATTKEQEDAKTQRKPKSRHAIIYRDGSRIPTFPKTLLPNNPKKPAASSQQQQHV